MGTLAGDPGNYTWLWIGGSMNKYAYYWEDEIMAECRQRAAELRERYVDDEGYNKHLDEDRPRLEAEGWHFETDEEFAARLARQSEH